MTREIVKFYFSFRSPYSWLAFTRIEKELASLPVKLEYVPIYPPSPSTLSERLKPPATKARYIVRDVARFAEAYGLELKFPSPFDTDWVNPHKGFLVAQAKGRGREYWLRVYRARFSEGRDVGDTGLLSEIAISCGLKQQEFRESFNTEGYAFEIKKCFDQAQADGVFGVPTFIYRDEMFWGNDRIEWLVREIKRSREKTLLTN